MTLLAGLVVVLMIGAASLAAYPRLFSSFAPYDDEGYVLLSLRMYIQGGALYDEVYTQYGPAYYTLHGVFHALTTVPVSHDVARFKTMLVWLGSALLCAVFIYRVTGLKILASVAFLATYFHLDRLALEPDHPHDVCLLVITGVLFLATFLQTRGAATVSQGAERCRRRRQTWILCAMGALTAVALMTKINVGVFLLTGTLLGLFLATPPGRWQRVGCTAVIAAAVMLPWLVARHHVYDVTGIQFPAVVSIAAGMVCWAAWQLPDRPVLSKESLLWYTCTVVAVCLLFCIWAMWRGSSMSGLAYGLVGQHLGFVDVFYQDPPIYLPAAFSAVAIAVLGVVAWRGNTTVARLFRLAIVVLIVGISLRHLGDTFSAITHGANDRGQAALLVSFFTPLVWIVLLPYREGQGTHHSYLASGLPARLFLCTIVVLQPLMAYPIPGTQMAIGSLGLLLAVFVSVGDCLRIRGLLGDGEPVFRRLLVVSLVSLSTVTLVCRDVQLWRQRSRLKPLDLAGARRIWLPPDYVARKQWTVARLKEHADTFLCLQNGHNSLYLWSDLQPPTGWNTTLWQDLLSDQQQQRVIGALQRPQRICVVVDKDEPLPRRRDTPLAMFIHRWFKPVFRHGSTEIWLPNAECIKPL